MSQARMDTFGFDKARFVGIYDEEKSSILKPLQLPLHIDNGLMMVVQLDDPVSKKCYTKDPTASDYVVFTNKYFSVDKEDLKTAFAVQGKEFFASLSQLVACVGCRRSVEQLYQQIQSLDNSVYESICVTENGGLTLSPSFMYSPQKIYHLFYCVRPKLFRFLESLMHGKKNKRCIFHSLKMQKTVELISDNKLSLPKWCSCSIMDVWDRMCHDCHKEIATLDCIGIAETIDAYLKKHRFCTECKSKVVRAFSMLTGEADPKKDSTFCSAIYEGLRCCSQTTTSTESGNPVVTASKHVHLCCERAFIVHLLSQADLEVEGAIKERHAKTIDVAQEEVCTCLAIHLHQRLYKVWQQKLTFEQTWLTLFYLGIETLRQNFETYVEVKVGAGKMEALCEEFEQADKERNQKIERKRMKRKRQKKKKEGKLNDDMLPHSSNGFCTENRAGCTLTNNGITPNQTSHTPGQFHICLLDMLNGKTECNCTIENIPDEDSAEEMEELQEEILEFRRNKSEIYAKRERLRERIRQDFENFCNITESQ